MKENFRAAGRKIHVWTKSFVHGHRRYIILETIPNAHAYAWSVDTRPEDRRYVCWEANQDISSRGRDRHGASLARIIRKERLSPCILIFSFGLDFARRAS